ncbi:NifU family protein [Streptomyces palmae]|uniref:Nitrogen fixation protein NifU n=1 Tax=Streptomyces palmae TaxID=1701085 RepID=A0A4Z0HI89_9ACTN|nr:NifU family protein [Streptomyces palmae]TGB18646.1 nitrogen fixation protein NifU [Streptomyces palmae]
MPWDDEQARTRVARTEELLTGLDSLPDGLAAARAQAALEALVALYGECLARVVDLAGATGGEQGAGLLRRLAEDELIGHLLLVHDLHPDPVPVRARRAVRELAEELSARGADLEVLELTDTAVRVRLTGGGCGCAAGSPELEQLVREGIAHRAPELERVTVETAPAAPARPLIPVDALLKGVRAPDPVLSARESG